MPDKKPVIHISGLFAGLLLFLALLAVQLNNVFFNADFQQSAVEKLNIYERIIASPDEPSLKGRNVPFEAAIKNSITPDLFNRNVKSLIDGLIDFVSGRTNNLPDLYIAGADKLSIAASAGVTPAAVEKINLQLVMMFSNEQNYNDILSVVSLIQFTLQYLPAFLILLSAAVVTAVLMKNSKEIIDWIHVMAVFYFILCWLAALLVSFTPRVVSLPVVPGTAAVGILKDYIRYCSGGISWGILLSGLILFAGTEIVINIFRRLNIRSDTLSPMDSVTGCRPAFKVRRLPLPCKALSVLLATAAVYLLLTSMLVSGTYGLFHKRNLGHAVSYIMGSISYNSYIDARNEDVCLLNLKVVNENDKLPVQDMQAVIYPLHAENDVGRDEKVMEMTPFIIDKDGTGSFLLSKGEFRLVLCSLDLSEYGGLGIPDTLSYDLSLATPGRTDLTIKLGSDPGTSSIAGMQHLKIVDASLQYMP